MTSPNLVSVQMPDLFSTPTVAGTADTSVGARPAASAGAGATHGESFSRLMHLQGRGRELEAKLAKQATSASSSDPAAMASAEQAKFNAGELKAIRELVGPAPAGNARRALAAILERLEGGGQFKPTDRARIRLAIAADEQRVDLPGANSFRSAILSLDSFFDASVEQSSDPSLIQDPARLAILKDQNAKAQQRLGELMHALGSTKLDPAAARAIATKVD
ncbi:MAG: hypothetical protein JWL76_2389 [Thermoleophilia bacterium]|nr:hypothetical protein [Thermoleophilia bacterium]